MLRPNNKISLRAKLAVIAMLVLISSVTALAINRIGRGTLFGRAATRQEQRPVAVPVPLAVALVPVGLPVALTNTTAMVESDGSSKSQPVSSINLQAVALGADKLTSLNLMVLEFDERGLLRRVDGFVKRLDLVAGKSEAVSLRLDRRVRIGYRLALAVERADSAARRWEADFNDLARGVALAVAGNPTASVTARNDAPAAPDTGASLCGNGMRRATAMAQAGDKSGLASFTCSQTEGSFTFSFNGKALF